MKALKIGLITLTLIGSFSSYCQNTQKYWLDFSDKVEVNDSFSIDSLVIKSKSEWLNSVSVELTANQVNSLKMNPLILKIDKVKTVEVSRNDASNLRGYGDYVSALKPEFFDKNSIDGRGVIAGVIDAGFVNVDSGKAYEHLVKNNRILGYRDFILDSTRTDFFDKQTSGDGHGAQVLAYMGGYDPETNQRIGLATGASYFLARTENGDKEHLVEEDDWIEAIEWMYNNGVRVVNTSLGYSEFDDTTENHTIYDMNGKTTKISIAAQKAVDRGMILVCSAGNLGLKPWRYVSAPADAEGVISVGATYKIDNAKEGYSSVGPEFNAYLKPDISSYSDRGTSYSSPEIAGLVTCILQKYPAINMKEIKQALAISGSMYPLPNNYVGYGVPNPEILFDYLAGEHSEGRTVRYLNQKGEFSKIKIDSTLKTNVVVYHKKDRLHVIEQIRISNKILTKEEKKLSKAIGEKVEKSGKSKISKKGARLYIQKPDGAAFSTVVVNGELLEIIWEK